MYISRTKIVVLTIKFVDIWYVLINGNGWMSLHSVTMDEGDNATQFINIHLIQNKVCSSIQCSVHNAHTLLWKDHFIGWIYYFHLMNLLQYQLLELFKNAELKKEYIFKIRLKSILFLSMNNIRWPGHIFNNIITQ